MHLNSAEARCLAVASYIIDTSCTIRDAARIFGCSKTTVHKDLRVRLPQQSPDLAHAVDTILRTNLAERHIRRGISTKRRWEDKLRVE